MLHPTRRLHSTHEPFPVSAVRSRHLLTVWNPSFGDLLGTDPDEVDHVPPYYQGHQGQPAAFWLLIDDIRRTGTDDTVSTIETLKKLRNPRYHDRPVSLYGGMVESPLILWNEEGTGWFANPDVLTEGRLWAERNAEYRCEVDRLGGELCDNLLGREMWSSMEPASRTVLGSAEAVSRSGHGEPAFDFTDPAVRYAKAVETELNALLFPALRRVLERPIGCEGLIVRIARVRMRMRAG